jgi:hypothetical protein
MAKSSASANRFAGQRQEETSFIKIDVNRHGIEAPGMPGPHRARQRWLDFAAPQWPTFSVSLTIYIYFNSLKVERVGSQFALASHLTS